VNNLIMVDGRVGSEVFAWLLQNYPNDVGAVVTTSENEIYRQCRLASIPVCAYDNTASPLAWISKFDIPFDWGLLIWWPSIIKADLICLPKNGFLNTHPSFLPYCRGKHYNFWTLVEQAPFGVSIHKVENGVDTGEIVAQRRIEYGWTDTGGTLYNKAQSAMISLFKDFYPTLSESPLVGRPQNPGVGSFHFAREMEPASRIHLERNYKARDLINLIRARTFPRHPACTFEDNGEVYEIRLEINRKV
jgi:methionyl-tRNA formyltransferase